MPDGDLTPMCHHVKALWVDLTCGKCMTCCQCPEKKVEAQPVASRAAQIILHSKRAKPQSV